jgi:hypothetical protein
MAFRVVMMALLISTMGCASVRAEDQLTEWRSSGTDLQIVMRAWEAVRGAIGADARIEDFSIVALFKSPGAPPSVEFYETPPSGLQNGSMIVSTRARAFLVEVRNGEAVIVQRRDPK